jgi:DNA-binding transcriptional ArsR family regulator
MNEDQLWRAVADPTRRRLIELLREGPRTTGALCRQFSTTRFAVMKHLGVLERAGVIAVRRSGRERWNVLNPETLRVLERPGDGGGQAGGPAQIRISIEAAIDAPPWRVFDALTVNVAAWWGAPHLRASDASNLVLEPQPGGRFVEEWGHRQGVLRAIVTAIRQDERIELTGTVPGAAPAVLDIRLERHEGGTRLAASLSREHGDHAVEAFDRCALEDLLGGRLKAFVEHGTRSGVNP